MKAKLDPNNIEQADQQESAEAEFLRMKDDFIKRPETQWWVEQLKESRQELLSTLNQKSSRPDIDTHLYYFYGRLDFLNEQINELTTDTN